MRWATVLTATLALAVTLPAVTNAAVVRRFQVPVDTVTVLPDCATGGFVEAIHLTGTALFVDTSTTDASGGTHLTFHVSYQGVSGVGLTTGTTYRIVGASDGTINLDQAEKFTSVAPFGQIIGRGPGNDFLIRTEIHSTISGSGFVAVSFARVRFECK
jgi:hypothetical protein